MNKEPPLLGLLIRRMEHRRMARPSHFELPWNALIATSVLALLLSIISISITVAVWLG
jgi:hypothetical protein